jgi:hypothetical protein
MTEEKHGQKLGRLLQGKLFGGFTHGFSSGPLENARSMGL